MSSPEGSLIKQPCDQVMLVHKRMRILRSRFYRNFNMDFGTSRNVAQTGVEKKNVSGVLVSGIELGIWMKKGH